MMELTYFLQICVIFFAVMGYLRGVYKEFVGLTGLLLGLYLMTEFGWLLDVLIGGANAATRLTVDAILLGMLTFFAYQQAPMMFVPRMYRKGNKIVLPVESGWSRGFLGAVLGGFNGYLVVGSLWYWMDQLEYPLNNLFSQPQVGSASAEFVRNLPLVWLQQNNLLLFMVMGLFLLIIIFR